MKKKILIMLVVLLLLASTIQVAFAEPNPPPNPNGGSCNMGHSVWLPGEGPGNANGVKPGERGMYHVHTKDMPDKVGYTNGAANMDAVTTAHCGP